MSQTEEPHQRKLAFLSGESKKKLIKVCIELRVPDREKAHSLGILQGFLIDYDLGTLMKLRPVDGKRSPIGFEHSSIDDINLKHLRGRRGLRSRGNQFDLTIPLNFALRCHMLPHLPRVNRDLLSRNLLQIKNRPFLILVQWLLLWKANRKKQRELIHSVI